MKKLLVVLFLLLVIDVKSVYAASAQFYGAEWLPNIYYTKEKDGYYKSRGTQVIRNRATGDVAYCIEPFEMLIDDYKYNSGITDYQNLLSINESEWERIKLLAYYGYGYLNHTDKKWISITQMMIWRTVDSKGKFYWVDKIDGKEIKPYEKEIVELNNLVNNHFKVPSFASESIYLTINDEVIITDHNGVIDDYQIKLIDENIDANIKDDKLLINSTNEGTYKITLVKKASQYKNKAYFYISSESQSIINPGNFNDIEFDLKIIVESGKIKITKLDYDNKSKAPQGEAMLIGAVYGLYDSNDVLIDKLIINSNNEAIKTNIKYGKYYLKELQSGTGYYLDNIIYNITINHEEKDIYLDLYNQVIKTKIVINKFYGTHDQMKPEANISFEFFDSFGNFITKVTTDINGYADIILPYGHYKVIQFNTTPNYQKVADFDIVIDENSNNIIEYHLNDLKVDTPNAGISNQYKLSLFPSFFVILPSRRRYYV